MTFIAFKMCLQFLYDHAYLSGLNLLFNESRYLKEKHLVEQ